MDLKSYRISTKPFYFSKSDREGLQETYDDRPNHAKDGQHNL